MKVAVLKARGKRALADVNVHCKMTSVITLDGVKHERLYKYMSTYMQNSSTIAGFLQCTGSPESWKMLKT